MNKNADQDYILQLWQYLPTKSYWYRTKNIKRFFLCSAGNCVCAVCIIIKNVNIEKRLAIKKGLYLNKK